MDISIIGSCQSRDIFNSRFIKEYRQYFNISSYFSMTSLLSITGKPIAYSYSKLIKSGFKDCLMEHWYQELEKNALKTLESKQPDVLLMDFYGDVRYGAIAYGSEYVINRVDKLQDKGILNWEKFGKIYNYDENTEEFIVMWKAAFDKFMEFMSSKLPDTTIVINTVKGTKIVTDDEGNRYISPSVENLDVDSINRLWKMFDDYAINTYNLKSITYEKEYTLDAKYPFSGLGYALVHYHPEYYRDCFNRLIEQTSNVKKNEKKDVAVNLVRDSSYKDKLRNWTNKAGRFEIIENKGVRSISVIDCGEKLGEYRPQIWSKPIEINKDGEVTYTLSFYIKVGDISMLDKDDVIFAMRTYKYVREVKMKESIEEYRLTIRDHNIQSGKEYRYIYTFTPKGNYIKLAPLLFKYLPAIEYSRIKLERSSRASEYTE